jgi:putative hemolysin
MNLTANRISKILGLGRVEIEEPVHSEEELEILVDRADEAGEFHEEHGELLRRAFDFADLNVSHVMIPMSLAGVMDSNVTVEELAKKLNERPFTRWPLRDPTTGRINGIVSIKMVLFAVAQEAGHEIILHDLAVKPHYLDPDLPLVDALAEMRKARQHLCIVRDPTGPDLGIVTLEDILGAIAGELPKEARPLRGRTTLPPLPPKPSAEVRTRA